MEKSNIFTNAELIALNKRFEGIKKDQTGIYSNRVKPKLFELLDWFKQIKQIKRLLK